jgi:DNA modification methylase
MTPFYQDDTVTIYHGDCRDVLPLLPKVDLVLTDPPYVLTAQGGGLAKKRRYAERLAGLTGGFDCSMLDAYPNWFCFCAKAQLVELISLAAKGGRWMLLTWNKPDPTPLCNHNYLPDTEYIVHRFQAIHGDYSCRSRFMVLPGGEKTFHPTAKPLPLISKLVRLGSEPGETILDPFMGSGTTLKAAKDLGRKAIGIEIEERYCEIAAKRVSQGVLSKTRS